MGIIISNRSGRVLWCRRVGQDAWQFPQGGIKEHETPEQALFRELEEETGLVASQVALLGGTRGWLRYRLPSHLVRRDSGRICVGQKQRWFLLKLTQENADLHLNRAPKPEFDDWRWVKYWYPVKKVIYFKKRVYRRALTELEPLLVNALCPIEKQGT